MRLKSAQIFENFTSLKPVSDDNAKGDLYLNQFPSKFKEFAFLEADLTGLKDSIEHILRWEITD